jgi:hypothetical protein
MFLEAGLEPVLHGLYIMVGLGLVFLCMKCALCCYLHTLSIFQAEVRDRSRERFVIGRPEAGH